MKTLDYIKNIIKVMIWPILFGIGQFFVILIFTFSFNNNIYNNLVQNNSNLSTEEINEMFNLYTSSDEYSTLLTNYINDNTLWIVLIVAVIFIPLLIFKYKKQKKLNFKINKNIIFVILVGFSISILLNLIIININKLFNINNNLLDYKYLIQTIIASCLLGPIIEELLFRGVMFNKIKTFNDLNVSILLTTFIFAFFHDSITQMIYAFIIGYICIKLYVEYDTLLVPIIFHISCNLVVPLLNNFLVNLNYIYTILIIIVSLIIFIIFYKKMYKKN